MRRVLASLILGIFALSVSAATLLAAEKFAYVSLGKLFDEYAKTKEYDKILDTKQKAYESERDAKIKEIRGLQEKYDLLSDKEKEKKKTEIENKIQSFQQFAQQKEAELNNEKNEKMKEILKDIENVVKQYASKENYTLVFDDRFLVYQDKNLDITSKVAEILTKSYPGKK